MEIALLKSKSKDDMDLLLKMASKLNINVRLLSEDEMEDLGLGNAMKKARTGKYIDKEKFINKLQSK